MIKGSVHQKTQPSLALCVHQGQRQEACVRSAGPGKWERERCRSKGRGRQCELRQQRARTAHAGSCGPREGLPPLKSTVFTRTGRVCRVAQSCPALWDPVDSGPPGSSVHGILQARILEWVAMPSSLTHISTVN